MGELDPALSGRSGDVRRAATRQPADAEVGVDLVGQCALDRRAERAAAGAAVEVDRGGTTVRFGTVVVSGAAGAATEEALLLSSRLWFNFKLDEIFGRK